jgi:peptidoglycan-associated lipoprotein
MRLSAILVAASAFAILSGCSSTPTSDQNAAPVTEAKPMTAPGPTAAPSVTETPNTVNLTNQQPPATPNNELTDPKSPLSRRSVYFDFDKYDVKDEFRGLLQAHATYLNRNHSAKMLIQGNCDERGSREYNLALGQRRSDAVKKTMGLLGASESQMESVSLGKEKPRCTDHSEECFAENRRADMLYSAGNVKEF